MQLSYYQHKCSISIFYNTLSKYIRKYCSTVLRWMSKIINKSVIVLFWCDQKRHWLCFLIVSVSGLMTPGCKLFSRTFEGSVDSQIMIDFIDEFAVQTKKRTFVILDNAPIHKSKKSLQILLAGKNWIWKSFFFLLILLS